MSDKKRKKKRSSRQQSTQWDDVTTETSGHHIYNYYTLNNASVVQLGSDNSVVFKEARSLLDNPRDAAQHGLGESHIFVALINSIINPRCSQKAVEMPIKVLEESFVKHFQGHSPIRTFKDAYGIPIRRFLQSHTEFYQLYYKKGKEMVRMNTKGDRSETGVKTLVSETPDSKTKSSSEQTLPKCIDTVDDRVFEKGHERRATSSDADEATACLSSEEREVCLGEESESDPSGDQSWNQQREKKSKFRSKKYVVVSANTSSTSEDLEPPMKTFEFDSDLQHVKDLLRRPKSDVLIFYPDERAYTDQPVQFMIDVVSLWNTPSRHKASIVLGVLCSDTGPHLVVGLNVRGGEDLYQSMFMSEYFTMKPLFSYKEYVYEGKVVGIIEVASSFGGGAPSIVSRDLGTGLIADQLWVRSGQQNIVCRQKDFLTVQVYQWFAGSASSVQSRNEPRSENCQTKSEPRVLERAGNADFCTAVGNFEKGHFVLITGGISANTKFVESLALVPWVAIYDFDQYSRDTGLLSTLEDVVKSQRYLHISTWKNNASGITESGTQWVCLRGLRESPDSRTEDNPKIWLQAVRGNLDSICIQLARFSEDYTVLRLIVLWPENDINAQCIYKFVCRMNEHLQEPPRIILIFENEPNSVACKSAMELLVSDNTENIVKLKMDFRHLCSMVDEITKKTDVHTRLTYALPKEEGHLSHDLTNKDAAWLKEDLEVLYLSNPYTKGASDVDALTKEVENFFRGGTLHWFAWYEFGTTHVDVERAILHKIIDHIDQKFLKEFKSGVITLFHAPGSGGTTLAQRTIWELRKKVPCCQVKQRSGSSLDDLAAKIRCLYDNTHLPVVILIDGEDEPRVKQLLRCLTSACVVFLYIKRYPYRISDPVCRPRENKFWLRGQVTEDEANILALKFSDRCEEESKKSTLRRLCKEVQQKKRTHFMYEFGMTVYHNEFKGIEAFVKGYLRLDTNPTRELQPWQKILGFLSLVYYYGQSSMPCKVFAPLLCKPANYDVEIEDFHYPIREFIVEDAIDGKRKNIRICHYFLAKEILEQLLNRSSKGWRGDTLSREAKRNLQSFCVEFISMFSSKKTKSSQTSNNITTILARTFIFRDNKDVGENEPQSKKRPLFSQVILDVDSDPPYTGRLEVLKMLSSSFQDDPNFLAHLGRFYAYCRPEEEQMAEKCFKGALELCKRWNSTRVFQGTDEGVKLTLMHIYHMYGIIYQRRIAKFTGRGPDEKPDIKTSSRDFGQRAQEILKDAETACSYFSQCRENTPAGHEECYGFSNEILVRLQVCDFVSRNYKDGTMTNFVTLRRDNTEYPVATFIKESIMEIEDLILECYSLIDPDNIDHTFQKAVLWYNHLFGRNPVDLTPLMHGDDEPSRRLLITVKKLNFSRNENLTVFDGPMPAENVDELVHLYEENFEDAKLMGDVNKRQLEMDFKEWLSAVRHPSFPKKYTLHEVLSYVRYWQETVQSPTSKFYHFVLLSLIGFGSDAMKGNSESLVEAQLLKEDMMKLSKSVLRPRFPREWMGKSNNGIKRLVPNTRISGYIEGRSIKGVLPTILSVSKGTITHPNTKKLAGNIDLDLGDNSIPIKVFFIPLLADMYGTRFAGQRVQFYLAFTLDHGYEAYNIQELNKYPCVLCGQKLEIKLDEETGVCICGHMVEKNEVAVSANETQEVGEG